MSSLADFPPDMRALALLAVALLLPAGGALPTGDNDAGSGRDAPNTASSGVAIGPGVVYEGGFALTGDAADWYTFSATAGDDLEGAVWPGGTCVTFMTPSRAVRVGSCIVSTGASVVRGTANETGTWYVGISQPVRSTTPQYGFSIGVGTGALDPTPPGVPSLSSLNFIQPGERVGTPSGSCTLNFAYNGTGAQAGKVFIGTAAHCFSGLGASASVAGIGTIGTVVYMGDYSGLNSGSFSNGIPGTQLDFALIEVSPSLHARVRGEVLGHPGLPQAVKAHTTVRLGDRLDFSGHGTGFEATQPTREKRSGIFVTNGAGGTEWWGLAPISPGDSGGPVLHADGQAVGTATKFGLGGLTQAGAAGAWLDVAMAEASANGYPIVLRPAY